MRRLTLVNQSTYPTNLHVINYLVDRIRVKKLRTQFNPTKYGEAFLMNDEVFVIKKFSL